ncbi:WD40-repeat-containing domain protein [Microdochium trichocladiopsis]|uniref:WD40-repeat-containing domain protein n=1 Tax=Microdochium trichocladiopsis TaxID=1682393 RepID=A0A9P9BWB7_9PEZI|nr:WD40-repeat-containing domain protein [Microdochium trichocladiopsis]KAH7040440.1 WD40-repeat-containing domain protein [Microdochium trichocladiopsis]
MASTAPPRPRARPAHTQGVTRCAYTPNGSKLVTVGSNNTIRLYKTGFDGEPTNIDDCQEQNTALASRDDYFIVGSEDGTVSLYSISDATFDKFLLRSSLPIRDVAVSPDAKWCAVASDELTVKLVRTDDNSQIRHLNEHNKPTKHLAFDPSGSTIALACSDGIIYVYSLSSEQPELIRRVDGVIGPIDTESDVSSRVAWHPDGRAFAVPTPTRDIQVVSKGDWEKQRLFSGGHLGDITALEWSPNGALLASAGKDKKIVLWETKTQTILAKLDFANVIDICWHPSENLVSFTNSDGEVYIHPELVPEQHSPLLKLSRQPAPFIHDPQTELTTNLRRPEANGVHAGAPRRRRDSVDSYDSLLDGPLPEDEDFVEDDDGAGYVINGNGKRIPGPGNAVGSTNYKRRHIEPQYHEAFQPGSTPWRGNRKYLCLNLIGFVWTVDQDGHHTVTVEFYDHEFHRDFHFTDTFLYDKACLTDKGCLFSCPPTDDTPATIFYRPHETWTHRTDWRTQLPKGEAVLAMSLSDSFVTVTTTANYVRVYTLHGVPYRVYRPKSAPMVTCASWRDYVMTIGNGSVGADGFTRLQYTIQNLKRDEICQNEDIVALPEGATLKSVFFSDNGDPCIYDSTGTLLTLLHWRQPSKASWIPLLDTTLLPRLASGRKHESYYPIAVADGRFHCIILKGGDQYPYFPRPLLSEFDFSIPLTSEPPKTKSQNDDAMEDEADEASSEIRKLEQQYLLKDIAAAQLQDLIDSSGGAHAQRSSLARLELDIDKTLLQYLAIECREGEERGMRALELVELMRDRTGRMFEAAGKIAERYGRSILGEKIREVGEKRMNAMEEDY